MRKHAIGAVVVALLAGSSAALHAQGGGRGGRGAGPDWAAAAPHGTMCVDMDSVVKVEVVKGAAAAAQYGPDAAKGIVIIYAKPGPGLRNCTAPSGDDPLARLLLPPDLVLSHQQAINLTEQQRQTIQSSMVDTQRQLLDQQFKLNAEVEKLQSFLRSSTPDEAKVLEEMDKVLGAERDIKRAQLSLMVKLKNSLTQQQQSQLEGLRKQMPER
jgi:hypothetical protein